MARPGSRSFRPAGDPNRVTAPVQLRLLARPVAANDNRAPLARRLLLPVLFACILGAGLFGAYLVSV